MVSNPSRRPKNCWGDHAESVRRPQKTDRWISKDLMIHPMVLRKNQPLKTLSGNLDRTMASMVGPSKAGDDVCSNSHYRLFFCVVKQWLK